MSTIFPLRNLEETDLVERLLHTMISTPCRSRRLNWELTESAMVNDSPMASHQLDALLDGRHPRAFDDFGTGYSSLAILGNSRTVVKIDRSFMSTHRAGERSRTLVKAMISMAPDLGYSVVAEGV